ncbi:phage tail protein, partial [Clostridioides sp. ES-S-0077-01]|uniref:phage tail-collar fiber domain-containing protein n=1 Tax=Clostridioides sp. ES-S-0077-01 TaxID=2770782 RepID=UPI001D0F6459|nr:phage tail protein [Clostridioides sp. ES-S-0077-01]
TADSGSVKDLVIKIILVVSNTSSVNLKVDPTVILATLKDIQDLDTKIDTTKTELTTNLETAKTELNEKIGDTTLLETTDKTTLVGAINEVKTSVDSIETTAEKTSIKDIDNLFESDNVEGALKEVFQNGVNAKNNVVTALNSKGAEVATSDTWEEIKNKIGKKEGRLDLRETKLSGYNPYLVTNGSLKNLDKYSGNLKAFECE